MKRHLNLSPDQKAIILGDRNGTTGRLDDRTTGQRDNGTTGLAAELEQLRERNTMLKERLRLTLENAQIELQLLLGSDQLTKIMRVVVETVGEHFGLSIPVLTGRCRRENIAWPRMIAYYLARQLTGASSTQIGKTLSRDHGTILNGCSLVEFRLNQSEETARVVETLKQRAEEKIKISAS